MNESDRILVSAIGRRVEDAWNGVVGTVRQWEPWTPAMNDALIQRADGSEIWVTLSACRPLDGKGPLPKREDACAARDTEVIASLKSIKEKAIEECRTARWPGFEWAKPIMLQSIDGAIGEVRQRLKRQNE